MSDIPKNRKKTVRQKRVDNVDNVDKSRFSSHNLLIFSIYIIVHKLRMFVHKL